MLEQKSANPHATWPIRASVGAIASPMGGWRVVLELLLPFQLALECYHSHDQEAGWQIEQDSITRGLNPLMASYVLCDARVKSWPSMRSVSGLDTRNHCTVL